MTNAYVNAETIKAEYAPYHKMDLFDCGYRNGMAGAGHKEMYGVAGQAYDRGYEAAIRVKRAERWVEENVGAN